MPEANCPVKISGTHYVEWMKVPDTIHYGDFGTTKTGEYQRGICMDCGEQFTK